MSDNKLVTYVPPGNISSRPPSFTSLTDFSPLRPGAKPGQLLRGPRRVVRLCFFALLVPAVLITIPLYVRLILYPPAQYPMMPTDQRVISSHVSSLWCQAQMTHMNGSFTGYLSKDVPKMGHNKRTHYMLYHLKLEDDIKEYWGFHLLKGSTVTISSCARWDGGNLMILRGVENLHRCAWIGEEDSAEDMAEDDDITSNERHRLEEILRQSKPRIITHFNDETNGVHGNTGREHGNVGEEKENNADLNERDLISDVRGLGLVSGDHNSTNNLSIEHKGIHLESEERRQTIKELLREAIRMSKSKKEILRILHTEGKSRNFKREEEELTVINTTESLKNDTRENINSGANTQSSFGLNNETKSEKRMELHKTGNISTTSTREKTGTSFVETPSYINKTTVNSYNTSSNKQLSRRKDETRRGKKGGKRRRSKKKGNNRKRNLTEEEMDEGKIEEDRRIQVDNGRKQEVKEDNRRGRGKAKKDDGREVEYSRGGGGGGGEKNDKKLQVKDNTETGTAENDRQTKDDNMMEYHRINRTRRELSAAVNYKMMNKPEDKKRGRRQVKIEDDESENTALEELDTDDIMSVLKESKQGRTPSAENLVGGQIFFPEGLKFERGTFNQTTKHDYSREEHVSSYSSSEEALASCEGVILTLPLVSFRSCNFLNNLNINKIVYDIPVTGTYYFVFSSDNEIYVNDLFFNLTMERVVYNVTANDQVCANVTECAIPLTFWSNEEAVVEVPQEEGWDNSYILDTKCEPRVYVYLTVLLLVPICIMFCAFH